jgi:hypothetical protein
MAYLPPCSPELNPQEPIWDELTEKHFGNIHFKNMNALMGALAEDLRSMKTSPAALKSLTQKDWMKKGTWSALILNWPCNVCGPCNEFCVN